MCFPEGYPTSESESNIFKRLISIFCRSSGIGGLVGRRVALFEDSGQFNPKRGLHLTRRRTSPKLRTNVACSPHHSYFLILKISMRKLSLIATLMVISVACNSHMDATPIPNLQLPPVFTHSGF